MQSSPSFLHRAAPGNGTQYDLCYFKRSGGGWAVTWEAVGLVARLRETYAGNTTSYALEPVGEGWSAPDLQAVESITNGLDVRHALAGKAGR